MPNDFLEKYGDVPFGELSARVVSDVPVETTPVVETPAAVPVTPEQPFLQTSTGTVYKRAEDAIQGIEHKDALIQRLRQEAIARDGVDPVTGQPVVKPVPQVNYTQDPEAYAKALADAVEKGDMTAYQQAQQKLVMDSMAPYAGAIAGFVKSQAADSVAGEVKDFRDFQRSSDYQNVLNENPVLRQSIEFAESNPGNAQNLSEFYKMAYRLNVARKLPEAVRAPTGAPAVARPTMTSTTTQAPPSQGQVVAPSLATSEGRKAIIAQQLQLGVENLRF